MSKNLPTRTTTHEVEVIEARPVAAARPVETGMAERPSRTRRALFMWLRILIRDGNAGSKVDVRLPIPVPLIGLFLRKRLRGDELVRAYAEHTGNDRPTRAELRELRDKLEAAAGFEFVRIQDGNDLVVIRLE